MSYYGGGGGGGGGVTDHRLLAGRSEPGQHPAEAIDVSPITVIGADAVTVQSALERLAERSGTEAVRAVAAVAVGFGKAVAFREDGRIEPADHDTPSHCSRLAGVTLASATAGTEARVCVDGPVQCPGRTWIPGAPMFVGRKGDLTQTPPATGFVQHLGFALGRDSLLVQAKQAIRRT